MRTRRRSRGSAAPARRLAALLVAVLTFLFTAAPGAVAAPSPPVPQAGTSGHLTLLLPPGTTSHDLTKIMQAAQQLVDDPMGRELIRTYLAFKRNGWVPANVSVTWYDLSPMRTDPRIPAWLRERFDEFFSHLQDEMENPSLKTPGYQVRATVLSNSGEPELNARLGVKDPRYTLQVGTGNKSHAGHSEINAEDWLGRAVARSLNEMRTYKVGNQTFTIGAKDIRAVTAAITQFARRGLAGQRTPCVACIPKTANIPRILAAVYYEDSGTESAALAREVVPLLMSSAEPRLRKRDRDQANRRRVAALGGNCDGIIGAPRGHGGGQVVAMAALPPALAAARRCGGEEEGGLAKALASQNLGGVDFTTLQMRYMSDDAGSGGLKYAFSGRPAAPGAAQDPETGLGAVTDSATDLRTWLVLDPSKFWVNLNPDEPDRIIDPALGRTNAGRSLLDADYQMKRTAGKLVDPATALGARYWDELASSGDRTCYSSRLWIVPGDVEVREDGSSLYVLKADLSVKTQAMHFSGGGALGCRSDPASDAHNEQVERTLVLPKVVQAVNTAPEYAPIRRAFLARVVAQWIRERHREGHRTSFDALIGSGRLGPAVLQDGWRPRQVYDAFVRSIHDGDFTYTRTVERGGVKVMTRMTTGGVDFSRIPMDAVSATRMNREDPGLPQAARASTDRPATARDGSIWLGETAPMPKEGLLSRAGGSVRAFASGRTGIAVIILVALVVVVFGLRTGSGRRRRTS